MKMGPDRLARTGGD